ncbi:hypothetical protein CBOM_04938 [Ceraceosorus bombacis]|uniref:Uncharacterized protein n=1 Tax=Ceraceosorus bombacis TaxID=401625 RepID=A0A0P1BHZ5_9BASI|nr:hypothetical protein CBOM_04938 [Ceraceosorus bombacis]
MSGLHSSGKTPRSRPGPGLRWGSVNRNTQPLPAQQSRQALSTLPRSTHLDSALAFESRMALPGPEEHHYANIPAALCVRSSVRA